MPIDHQTLAAEIEHLARTGLAETSNHFSHERYRTLLELAAQIRAAPAGARTPPAHPVAAALPAGLATPKIDVRGACFRAGKLLLVQERHEGCWNLPGGWADVGDIPARAAEREVYEESGFTCRAVKLIGLFDANRTGNDAGYNDLATFHAYKLIYRCEITGGQPTPNHEISAIRFVSQTDPPAFTSARTTAFQFAETFAHYHDPTRPTYFD